MKKITILLSIFFGSVILGYAQQNALHMTFESAVEMAMSRNGQIKINYYNEEIKRKEKKIAATLRSPQFLFGANYTYMSGPVSLDLNGYKDAVGKILPMLNLPLPPELVSQFMGKDWKAELQKRQFAVMGFSAVVPIFTGGKINVANRAARIAIEEQDAASLEKIGDLYNETVERYYGLLMAVHLVEVREQVLAGMQQHLHDAIELEKNGTIAKVERLYAQVKVSEASSELKKAMSAVQTIRTALSATIGVTDQIAPISSLFILKSVAPSDDFKRLALENNPKLKQVALKEKLAKEGLKLQRASYYPQLAAMGGYDVYNYQLTSMAPKWVVGAGLKLTIFDGLNREFKVSAAKSQIKMVEAVKDKANTDISALVEKQYNEMLSERDNVTSQEATIEFATEYLRVKKIAFSEGSATSVDVTDAILNLAKARIERLNSAYQFDKNLSLLLQTCGDSFRFAELKNSASYQQIEK
ncbi:MAG: TolC family protein [Rikenellaceae bacterium]